MQFVTFQVLAKSNQLLASKKGKSSLGLLKAKMHADQNELYKAKANSNLLAIIFNRILSSYFSQTAFMEETKASLTRNFSLLKMLA